MALAARRGRKESRPAFPGSQPPRTKSLGTIHLVRLDWRTLQCCLTAWRHAGCFIVSLHNVERFLIDGSSAVGTLQGWCESAKSPNSLPWLLTSRST